MTEIAKVAASQVVSRESRASWKTPVSAPHFMARCFRKDGHVWRPTHSATQLRRDARTRGNSCPGIASPVDERNVTKSALGPCVGCVPELFPKAHEVVASGHRNRMFG